MPYVSFVLFWNVTNNLLIIMLHNILSLVGAVMIKRNLSFLNQDGKWEICAKTRGLSFGVIAGTETTFPTAHSLLFQLGMVVLFLDTYV